MGERQNAGSLQAPEAPVITLNESLDRGETIFIMSGLIPNRKGHPLVHAWFGVSFIGQNYTAIKNFESIIEQVGLGRKSHPFIRRGSTMTRRVGDSGRRCTGG